MLRFLQASRIATTSAWPVGSFVEVTWLLPRPTISPSLTTTAPKGPPSFDCMPCWEILMAAAMKLFMLLWGCGGSSGVEFSPEAKTVILLFVSSIASFFRVFRPFHACGRASAIRRARIEI